MALHHEVRAGIPIAAALIVVFGCVSSTPWAETLFYNGDSLSMPIFLKALGRPEPFMWTSSAFLGFVPELPIFWFAALAAPSMRAAIVLNGILNFVLLYAVLRWLIALTSNRPQMARRWFASGATTVLALFAAAEITSGTLQLTSYLLFSTYYSGVVLVGLVCLCLVLTVLRRNASGQSTYKVLIGLGGLVAAATFSNSLFAIVAVAPLAGALVVASVVDRRRRRTYFTLSTVACLAALVGDSLRVLLGPMIVTNATEYVRPTLIGTTFRLYGHSIAAFASTPFGLVETLVVLVAIGVVARSAWRAGSACRDRRLPSGGSFDPILVVGLFGLGAVVAGPVALGLAGANTTRYLTAVTVFPVAAAMVALDSAVPVIRRSLRRGVAVAAVSALGFLTVATAGSAAAVTTKGGDHDYHCVMAAVDLPGAFGVSGFWVSRAIDLYADGDVHVLQVTPSLTIFPWLSNLGAYEGHDFTFVLVTKETAGPYRVVKGDVAMLGRPTSIRHCPTVDVYLYLAGSPGHQVLNDRIRTSYEWRKADYRR